MINLNLKVNDVKSEYVSKISFKADVSVFKFYI